MLAGRLQIFNNWSPYMVKDPETVWIGVEYFCYETDSMWNLPDSEMAALGRGASWNESELSRVRT